MSSNKGTQAKRKYSRISLKVGVVLSQKRQLLVSLVVNEGFTIARAARRVTIRASTARMIINKYKETGTYPIKNFKNPVKSVRIISPGDPPSVKHEEEFSSSQNSSCEAKESEPALEEVPREEAVVRQLLPPVLLGNYCPMYYYPFSPYFA